MIMHKEENMLKNFFLIEQVNLQNNMFPFNNEKAKQKQ